MSFLEKNKLLKMPHGSTFGWLVGWETCKLVEKKKENFRFTRRDSFKKKIQGVVGTN